MNLKYVPVIGLEIHVQLHTNSKLFCGCSTKGIEPNSATCPICLGHPGSKPVLNKKALDYALKIAMALNCQINESFSFSRKTYFYPDLSKNYQITQYELPIGQNGFLELSSGKKIRITRVHLEEDPAALIHENSCCLADYNRSGIPLAEIVTEPDLASPSEAREFMDRLLNLLNFLEVFKLGEDTLKADSNISLKGSERAEVKNVSGFRNIEKALQYEIERQTKMRDENEKISRETRGFNEERQTTYLLRKKESEEDYGYIFEPDLTPYRLSKKDLDEIKKTIPELPAQKSARFQKQFGLAAYDANVLCASKKLSDLFEEIAKSVSPKTVSVFLTREILGIVNYNKLELDSVELNAVHLTELLQLLENKKVSEKNAKEAAIHYVLEKTPPKTYLEKQNLLMDTNSMDAEKIVEKILVQNPKAAEDLKSGNPKSLNFLVGLVMRETKGKANPREIQKMIEKKVKK
ncbi:MAG: Asp-tRNA(Asn)/Glu-tRNA(Gln) amidotransferase subunit GatB [Candidatus Micrarchaeota archaeon]